MLRMPDHPSTDADTDPLVAGDAVRRSWGSLAELRLDEGDELVRHDIAGAPGELPLSALALRRPGSDRLVVHLHGTLDRTHDELPRFERLRSLSALDANLLLLADTTLGLERSLATAWFVGDPETPLIDRYASLVRRAIEAWGIRSAVVAGASSGGFAALAMAPRVPEALAVAISPQTRLRLRPTARPFRQFVYNRFGGWDGIEARPELRERVDLVHRYEALGPGRAWYVQNSGDLEHLDRHARPFLEAHGGEIVRAAEEYHCPGHNPPSAERVRSWIERALEEPDADPRRFVREPPPEVPRIRR